MTEVKPFAFVLMPFNREFSDLYNFGIKKTANELNIVAERVDEQHFSELILERVYRQIENCDFIIADMTGQNPNVFYEVGYAHAKGKLCALITQSASDIPFDLKHHTHVIYDGSISDLVEKLRPKLQWLRDETKERQQQRISIAHKAGSGFLEKEEYLHRGSFDLEITLRNETSQRSPEIEAYYLITTRDWKLTIDSNNCPFDDFEHENGNKVRKHLVNPNIRRLAPAAFAQIKPEFHKVFWTKWRGEEMKDKYESRGTITMEIVTSEGTLAKELYVQVEFDEFPF